MLEYIEWLENEIVYLRKNIQAQFLWGIPKFYWVPEGFYGSARSRNPRFTEKDMLLVNLSVSQSVDELMAFGIS